jgi:hypothetical protein
MEELANICRCDPELLQATPYKLVDVTDPASESEAINWWKQLTERGGEGMVVKPHGFILRGTRGLAQPAVKCRARRGTGRVREDGSGRARIEGLPGDPGEAHTGCLVDGLHRVLSWGGAGEARKALGG